MRAIIRNPYFIFFSILLLFCIHRSAHIMFLFNKILRLEVTEWRTVGLSYDVLYQGEDFLTILKNPVMLFKYIDLVANTGVLLDAILYFPLACMFGINIISLKLLPFIYSIIALSVGMLYLYRNFSKIAMLYFGLFYVFASPVFIRWTLTLYQPAASGNHLFLLCSLFLYVKLLKENAFRKKHIYVAFFGFWLACVCFYQCTFSILVIAVFIDVIAFRRKVFTMADFFLFGISFLVGCAPFIFHFFVVNDFMGEILPQFMEKFIRYDDVGYKLCANENNTAIYNFLKRAYKSIIVYPKFSPLWGNAVVLFLAGAFYRIVLFFSCVNIFKKYKNYHIFWIYILTYYSVVSISSMAFDVDRYWLLLYPVVYLLVAVFLCFLHDQNYKKLSSVLFAVLLGLGVFDTCKSFTYSHSPRLISKFDGMSYYLNNDISNIDEENIDDVNRFLQENNFLVKEGMTYNVKSKQNYPLLLGFNLVFEVLNPNYLYIYNGLVPFSYEKIDIELFIKEYNRCLAKYPDSKNIICEGLGWALGIKLLWDEQKVIDWIDAIDIISEEKEFIMQGYRNGLK